MYGYIRLKNRRLRRAFAHRRISATQVAIKCVGIGIKLWPSLDAFRLMSDSLSPAEKVQIVDASFKLCVQRLDEGLIVSNEKNVKNTASHLSIFTF